MRQETTSWEDMYAYGNVQHPNLDPELITRLFPRLQHREMIASLNICAAVHGTVDDSGKEEDGEQRHVANAQIDIFFFATRWSFACTTPPKGRPDPWRTGISMKNVP